MITRHRGALEAAERIFIRIASTLGFAKARSDLDLARNVLGLYQRRHRIWLAMLLHIAAWLMGAVQVWAAAQAMDRPSHRPRRSHSRALYTRHVALSFSSRGAPAFRKGP